MYALGVARCSHPHMPRVVDRSGDSEEEQLAVRGSIIDATLLTSDLVDDLLVLGTRQRIGQLRWSVRMRPIPSFAITLRLGWLTAEGVLRADPPAVVGLEIRLPNELR